MEESVKLSIHRSGRNNSLSQRCLIFILLLCYTNKWLKRFIKYSQFPYLWNHSPFTLLNRPLWILHDLNWVGHFGAHKNVYYPLKCLGRDMNYINILKQLIKELLFHSVYRGFVGCALLHNKLDYRCREQHYVYVIEITFTLSDCDQIYSESVEQSCFFCPTCFLCSFMCRVFL
jgi:hypothetical protein